MGSFRGTARNVGALDDQEFVKQKLETIDGIENVTVFFGDEDDRDYSGGRRACTSKGNLIVITFERCSYADQFDGDVPELRLDATNAVLDPRTMLPVGDGVYLTGRDGRIDGLRRPGRHGTCEGRVAEKRPRDLCFRAGTARIRSRFVYDVMPGDAANPLEAVQLLDIHGDSVIVRAAAYPYALIDASLPPPQTAARYTRRARPTPSARRTTSSSTSVQPFGDRRDLPGGRRGVRRRGRPANLGDLR